MIFIEEIVGAPSVLMLRCGPRCLLRGSVLVVPQPQKRRQDRRTPNSCEPVEEFVPEAGGGEEPGAAVVEAKWGAGEGNCDEGIIVTALENGLRDFVAEVGGHGYAVAGVA